MLVQSRMTPLHCAIGQDSMQLAKLLVDADADLTAVDADTYYSQPLHHAIVQAKKCNNIQFVQYLVTKGAQPRGEGPKGNAVYEAIQQKLYDLARWLLEFDKQHEQQLADTVCKKKGQTPFFQAAAVGNAELALWMWNKSSKQVPLAVACGGTVFFLA